MRKTLTDINDYINGSGIELNIYAVPTGRKVFDWTIPKEWAITQAYIEDENGRHIIDMKDNNLHVVGYSCAVDKWVRYEELLDYIYTQPDMPDAIPYVTSYYKERFGFCMSEKMKQKLIPGQKYHIYIDSRLFNGNLNYADVIIEGQSSKEIMFSTYFCHPSMANNECSGLALQTRLIEYVSRMQKRKYTYRFVFIPETIGSITYMSEMGRLGYLKENLIAGFVLSCVGDDRNYSITHTKYGNTLADRVLSNVLKFRTNNKFNEYSFLERGSDEKEYGGPNCNLPVVAFSRTKYGEYPEYHTSKDDMNIINPSGFQGSFDTIVDVINALENNAIYKVMTYGDPQLGTRGLYPTTSQRGTYDEVEAMMNFIAYADGTNDLFAISEIIGVPVSTLILIAEKLQSNGLLEVFDDLA